MAGIWLANATVQPGNDGGAFIGVPWRGVLHTTQGTSTTGATGTFATNNSWPHLTVNPATREIIQHLSLDVAARSLEHKPPGSVDTNAANCVQIEIVCMAEDTPSWSIEELEFIAGVMRAVEALVPIPRRSGLFFEAYPASAGLNNGLRLSDSDWLDFSGWCGHQHVPRQLGGHGDPGKVDIEYLCSPHLLGVGSSQSNPGAAMVARTPYSLDVVIGRTAQPFAEGWDGTNWGGIGLPVGDGAVAPTGAGGVAAVARRPDIIDAFWVGPDGSLNTSWWTRSGGWAPTRFSIGDPAVKASTDGGIAAFGRHPGILDVFFIGDDDRPHTTWWTEQGGWATLSPALAGPASVDASGGVAAVSRRLGVIDVFMVGSDSRLYTTWWTEQGGWSPTVLQIGGAPVPVQAICGCAAVARTPDALDVAYVGTDGGLYTVSWTSATGWATPVRIGGPGAPLSNMVGGLAVVSRQPDVLDVFWVDPGGHLHTTWWTVAGGWNPATLQIGDPAVPLLHSATPTAVARQPSILDVTVVDLGGVARTTWWTQPGGWAPSYLILNV